MSHIPGMKIDKETMPGSLQFVSRQYVTGSHSHKTTVITSSSTGVQGWSIWRDKTHTKASTVWCGEWKWLWWEFFLRLTLNPSLFSKKYMYLGGGLGMGGKKVLHTLKTKSETIKLKPLKQNREHPCFPVCLVLKVTQVSVWLHIEDVSWLKIEF